MPDASPPQHLGGAQRRFLTFRVGERRYAVPAEEVEEVVRVPPIARLPQSPKALLGVANLRGSVMPVVSLPAVLGRPAGDAGGAARAIVLSGICSAALVVDAVEGLVSPEAGRIDGQQAELTAEPGERLAGIFPIGGGEDVARILDLPQMLASVFGAQAAPRRAGPRHSAAPPLHDETGKAADQRVLITFAVAGQEYALPLQGVREIVALPAAVAVVPRSESVLLGVVAHRDSLLPLMSLRGLLGFSEPGTPVEREKVIVTSIGGVLVGLVADRVRAVIRADPALIEPAPPMLAARAGGEARIAAMFRGEGDRRLISILAPDRLFREDVMRRLGSPSDSSDPAAANGRENHAESVQFLVFRLGAEEFGLPIGAVDEVARAPHAITRIPNAPAFLEGVINLRGEVLPVIDQRKRFGLPTHTGPGAERLVVVRTERHRAGLIVDSVSEVLRASAMAIEPAPELIERTSPLVEGVVNLPARGHMVLLLDPDALLNQAEHDLLDRFAGAPADQARS